MTRRAIQRLGFVDSDSDDYAASGGLLCLFLGTYGCHNGALIIVYHCLQQLEFNSSTMYT